MNRTTSQWTISIPPLLSKKASKLARVESRTKSELVREALRDYIAKKERVLVAREELAQKLKERGIKTIDDVNQFLHEGRG